MSTIINKPMPLMLYPQRYRPMRILQVGAGGTGARIAIALIKLLNSRDQYVIFDHDIVEKKNIFRQHFCEADIGKPKATVLAQRLMIGSSSDCNVVGFRKMFNQDGLYFDGAVGHTEAVVLIGAVDNVEARYEMMRALHASDYPTLYIDAGNELSGGQVTLDAKNWLFYDNPECRDEGTPGRMGRIRTFHGSSHFPRLWDLSAAPSAAPTCAIRVDTQSVAANHMAAALVINIMTWFLDQLPVMNAGSYFSTSGSCRTLMLSGSIDNIVVNR